jgi:cytochrome P450
MEGHIAINTLLRRMPDVRLAVAADEIHWRKGIMLRGLQALPVTF